MKIDIPNRFVEDLKKVCARYDKTPDEIVNDALTKYLDEIEKELSLEEDDIS